MNKYEILSKSSNGNFAHFKTVTLKDDDKATEVVENLEEKTGFEYKWEMIESLEEDDEDVVMDTGESDSDEEDEDVETVTEIDDDVFIEEADEDNYPRGWHRRSEFVDKEGTVFHKGEEQPDLYRTKEPSEY